MVVETGVTMGGETHVIVYTCEGIRGVMIGGERGVWGGIAGRLLI